jgi:anti-anti-sigma factor
MAAQTSCLVDASDPRFAVVRLFGRLDVAGTGAIELPLSEAVDGHTRIAVDLSRVSYLSSVGLRLLLLAARAAARRGGLLIVIDPHPNAARVLHATGFDGLVRTVPASGIAACFEQSPDPRAG